MKKIWNIISTTLVAAVVILAMLLAGVRLAGLQVYAVLSGSMEPTYHVGSLLYVKSVAPETLGEGDVITFMLTSDLVATHRIVGVVEEDGALAFATKGDANETADAGLVLDRNVIGKPVGSIPYLGYLSAYIQSPSGRYVAIAGCAALILLSIMPEVFSGEEKKKREKEDGKDTTSL